MAMLAEPRRKQKLAVDPRNLTWCTDDNQLGHKLMSKMGWSRGKGLGATEQGDVDNICIKMKNDARGLGCTKKYGDAWMAHQDDFTSLLANLNDDANLTENQTPTESSSVGSKVASLEQSSKAVKSRVHYGKFTRGKDLSNRGDAEMECILGKKRKKEHAKVISNDIDKKNKTDDSSGDQNLVTSGQSVGDYFKMKMEAIRLRKNLSNGNCPNNDDSSTVNVTKSNGIQAEELASNDNSCDNDLDVKTAKKDKKRKKSKDKDLLRSFENDGQSNENSCESNLDTKTDKKVKKSKKKSKDKALPEIFDEILPKKKSKKSKLSESEPTSQTCIDNEEVTTSSDTKTVKSLNKKLKRASSSLNKEPSRKKRKYELVVEKSDSDSEDHIILSKEKSKKKKKS